jgi:lysophospholipase L1-like esterase
MLPFSSRRAGGQSRSFRGLLRLMVAPLLLVSAFSISAVTGATTAAAATTPAYYLALGDSLSQGVQSDGAQPPDGGSIITDSGYVDDLYGHALLARPRLQLMKLGCPGETTNTMINGGICTYPEGSQLNAAYAFLSTNRVAFVTIDIGANDVDGCITAPDPQSCVQAALPVMAHNLGQILGTLRAASPTVKIFGMNYYDPFLAAWLSPGGQTGQDQAHQTEQLTEALDITLQGVYSHFSMLVANVYLAFLTGNFDIVQPFNEPANVLEICINTWMCTEGNIHANDTGYQLIADAFLKVNSHL